ASLPAFLLILLTLSGVMMGGCRPVTSTDAVKIGLVAPFEGAGRELGYAVLAAVQMAIRERNAAGDTAGRPIELVALNDEMDLLMSGMQMEKLVLDNAVLGVIGPWSPAAIYQAVPFASKYGLPVLLAVPYAHWLPDSTFVLAPSPSVFAQAAQTRFGSAPDAAFEMHIEDEELHTTVQEAFARQGLRVVDGEGTASPPAGGALTAVLGQEDFQDDTVLKDERYARVLVLYGPYAPLLRRLLPRERWPAVYVWQYVCQGERYRQFAQQYLRKTGQAPLAPAVQAYGAARQLCQAVDKVGPEPTRYTIRMALKALMEGQAAEGQGAVDMNWCAGAGVDWVPLSELP
ncbi:MAG: ABC transporter substrate-binding protein, partial [Anaerolineae bacterium]